MERLSKVIATVFFIGYFPVASGTLASMAGLLVYVMVKNNNFIYFSLSLILLLLGFWSSARAMRYFKESDPGEIVIDEFSSIFLVYFFIPFSVKFLIIGFLLFRFFDILKPPPIRNLENLPGGYGIMLDDVGSAIFANLALQILNFCFRPVFI